MQYKLVKSYYVEELEKIVSMWLDNGLQPLSGPIQFEEEDSCLIVQSLIRN